MDIIEIISLCLFLYSITTTIALFVADYVVKENFGWFQVFLCFIWPLTLIGYLFNRLWEKTG